MDKSFKPELRLALAISVNLVADASRDLQTLGDAARSCRRAREQFE